MYPNHPISSRLSAGALTYTLFVAVIASITLSALILGAYYYRLEYLTYEVKIDNLANMSSATSLALAMDEYDYKVPLRDKLFSEGEDSVEVDFQPWGAWDVVKLSTWKNQDQSSKYFSRAYARSTKGESALFLVDENRPVSVAGKTKISGDAYLPKAGIRSAYINRVGYLNRELLYGKKLVSEDKIPELQKTRMSTLKKFSEGNVSVLYPDELTIRGVEGSQVIPFSIDSILFNQYTSKTIQDSLIGRIWIHANKRIIVDRRAFLKNVILSAPIIEIDSGFTGVLQAIATDTILVRGGAKLKYPSFLAVINENPPATIQLESNVKVQGTIVLEGEVKEFNQRVLQILDKAEVEGMIYCHGLLETNGKVAGHVTTRKFLINTFSGVYENYIFNAELDGEAISPQFVGTDLWFNSKQKKVLQWLY